ncbi:MAG: adenylate cyclase [Rhizobium sp.]|uniref:adenylate cyclase n=1 Tax=Rhizobium sp. TaxID=391 RepID=UPI0030F19910
MQSSVPVERDPAPSSPRPPPGPDEIRTQLERIIANPEFPHSGRSADFLRYITEETLAGNAKRIKGYSVAVEVFKRDQGFSQDDPVVRIEAGRLRRTLERYYLVSGQDDPVLMDIPKGGYVPTFVWNNPRSAEPSVAAPPTTGPLGLGAVRRHGGWMVAGLLAVVLVSTFTLRPQGQSSLLGDAPTATPATAEPSLVVAPFANLGEGPKAEIYSAGLTEELLTALPRFKEIKVFGRETSRSLPPEIDAARVRSELGAGYLLTGGVRVSRDTMRVTARLLDTDDGEILWSQTYDENMGSGDLFAIQRNVANMVATAIAQPYGIIAQEDSANRPPDDVDAYACTLRFYTYRAELSPQLQGQVRECLESAVARYPSFATAWAMLSIVYLDEERFRFNARPGSSPAIERSLVAARRAIQLDPGSTRGHQALMMALFFNQQLDEALRVGERALATNPNDTELLGEFGTRVAMGGDWARGADLLQRAIALNPGGGGYYHGTRALSAFMLNDERTAVAEIRQADMQKFPLFHLVAAIIYAESGLDTEAKREGAQFVQMCPDFLPNLSAELRSRNVRPVDQARFVAAIRKAGLTTGIQSAISAPVTGSRL